MTQNLFLAVKSSWLARVEFSRFYITLPEILHDTDLMGVIDQIWAEEICKKSNMKSR